MGGYAAVIEEIHRAAALARTSSEQVGAADLAGALSPVTTALPGGTSEQAAVQVYGTWLTDITTVSARLATHATNLDQCRATYVHYEHTAAGRYARVLPPVSIPGFDVPSTPSSAPPANRVR